MPKLIGTAGHVDHGKTTLIRALTGIDADRLPEEKARGLTIDVGFAYIDLPGVGRTSIIDVPGHERFVGNMLVGATGVDVGLLCVAADESVMPQTREHFQILDLLPVERLVVALTKVELVDEATLGVVRSDVAEMMQGTRFEGSALIPVSAIAALGLDDLKLALVEALSGAERALAQEWFLPIDRAFTVKGHGLVVTGALELGVVQVGDKAIVMPGGLPVRVKSVHSHDETLERCEAGRRTALNLTGAKSEDVVRGQAVGSPGVLFASDVVDAKVRWLEQPKHGQRVRVAIGTEEGIGRVFLNDAQPELAQFRFERPLAVAKGQPAIVRNYSPPKLLGGGPVTVPEAARRRKSEAAQQPVAADDDAATLLAILDTFPEGLAVEELVRRSGQSYQAFDKALGELRESGSALVFAGHVLSESGMVASVEALLLALGEVHRANPARAMVPREQVLARAKLTWKGKPLDRILARLAAQGHLRLMGTQICLVEWRAQLNLRQRELLDRVKAALEAAGYSVPAGRDLADGLHVPIFAIDEIVRVGIEAGELVALAEGLVYTRAQLVALMGKVRQELSGQRFTASQFREKLDTSRKYAIPLLEFLDARGVTTRQGDVRIVNESGRSDEPE